MSGLTGLLSGLSQGRDHYFLTLQESAAGLGGLRYVEVGSSSGRAKSRIVGAGGGGDVGRGGQSGGGMARRRSRSCSRCRWVCPSRRIDPVGRRRCRPRPSTSSGVALRGRGEEAGVPPLGEPDSGPEVGGSGGSTFAGPALVDHVATSFLSGTARRLRGTSVGRLAGCGRTAGPGPRTGDGRSARRAQSRRPLLPKQHVGKFDCAVRLERNTRKSW